MWNVSSAAPQKSSVWQAERFPPRAEPLLLFGPRLLAICCCVYTRQRTTVAQETFRWTSTQTWRDLPLSSFIHACCFALECRSIYTFSLVSFCMDYTDGKHLSFSVCVWGGGGRVWGFFHVVSGSNCSLALALILCV